MAWKGTFLKLRPGDMWSKEQNIVGVLSAPVGDSVQEILVVEEFVEDDGKPFEEGEEIEILIRRASR